MQSPNLYGTVIRISVHAPPRYPRIDTPISPWSCPTGTPPPPKNRRPNLSMVMSHRNHTLLTQSISLYFLHRRITYSDVSFYFKLQEAPDDSAVSLLSRHSSRINSSLFLVQYYRTTGGEKLLKPHNSWEHCELYLCL
jgi:hypothetical protein